MSSSRLRFIMHCRSRNTWVFGLPPFSRVAVRNEWPKATRSRHRILCEMRSTCTSAFLLERCRGRSRLLESVLVHRNILKGAGLRDLQRITPARLSSCEFEGYVLMPSQLAHVNHVSIASLVLWPMRRLVRPLRIFISFY